MSRDDDSSENKLSVWQRATAAIGGAVASAVVVNPLEGTVYERGESQLSLCYVYG